MIRLSKAIVTITFAVLLSPLLSEVCAAYGKTISGSGSAEETRIKGAYKKLMLYNKSAVSALSIERGSKIGARPEDSLQFEIRDILTTTLEEVHGRPFGELVTQPTGDVIRLDRETYDITNGPDHIMYQATWTQGQIPFEDWKSITVEEMLSRDKVRFADVGKISTYQVVLRFQGKERIYRAIALFHEPFQSVSEAAPELLDTVIGVDHMTNLAREKRMPVITPWDKYVRTALYRNYVRAFENGEEVDTNFAANCPPGYNSQVDPLWQGWCCNDSTMHCCLPSADAGELSCCGLLQAPTVESSNTGISNVIDGSGDPNSLDYCGGGSGDDDPGDSGGDGGGGFTCVDRRINFQPRSDSSIRYDDDHIVGEHWAYASFQGFCNYSSNCTVRCQMDWYRDLQPAQGSIEWGFNWVYNHVVTTDSKNHPEDGTQRRPGEPGEIICGRAWGVAWKYCVLPWCAGNIKISWAGQDFQTTSTEWNTWTFGPTQRCSLSPPPL